MIPNSEGVPRNLFEETNVVLQGKLDFWPKNFQIVFREIPNGEPNIHHSLGAP